MRSIPEKTLEHWASIYLSNRFPNGALWWPTSGEDVLVELPKLAASGPGKSLVLELKTTEVRGTDHVLEIDTRQLFRYLHPPGPPLPVYYVFPTPHWIGPLTSRSGMAPPSPTGSAATPPEWWRRRVGRAWFGGWLHVMPARSVASALSHGWTSPRRKKATLFTVNTSHLFGGVPDWSGLLKSSTFSPPMNWTRFWQVVTRCGPNDGVRWRTFAGKYGDAERVVVLDEGEEHEWLVDQLRNRSLWDREPGSDSVAGIEVDEGDVIGGNERVLVRIPETALR